MNVEYIDDEERDSVNLLIKDRELNVKYGKRLNQLFEKDLSKPSVGKESYIKTEMKIELLGDKPIHFSPKLLTF